MSLYRRMSSRDYIVYGLLAIGILTRIFTNPAPFVIPILVFGTIYLLYKFPPNRFTRHSKSRSAHKSYIPRKNERERKKSTFRVIYGNKPDSEDDPPRYH